MKRKSQNWVEIKASVQSVSPQKTDFCNGNQNLHKSDIKIFWSYPVLLDFLTFGKIFCY